MEKVTRGNQPPVARPETLACPLTLALSLQGRGFGWAWFFLAKWCKRRKTVTGNFSRDAEEKSSPSPRKGREYGAAGIQYVAAGERRERRQVRGPVSGDRGQERGGLPTQPDGDGSGRRLGRRVRSREAVLRADEERLQPYLVFDQGGLPQGSRGTPARQGRERGEETRKETQDLNGL